MFTPPMLARVAELHQSDLRDQVARDRQAEKAMAGTRTRGGSIFLAAARTPRAARAKTRSWNLRPAVG